MKTVVRLLLAVALNETVSVKGGLTYPFASRPNRFTVSSVFHTHNFLLGVDVAHETGYERQEDDKHSEVDAKTLINSSIGYIGQDYEAVLSVKNYPTKKDTRDNLLGVTWFHKISSAVKYGLNFSLDQSQTLGPAANVGGEYKLDDSTTLKGKFGVRTDDSSQTDFRLGLGTSLKISPNATATVGADINVRKLLGHNIGADPSFGLELKLNS